MSLLCVEKCDVVCKNKKKYGTASSGRGTEIKKKTGLFRRDDFFRRRTHATRPSSPVGGSLSSGDMGIDVESFTDDVIPFRNKQQKCNASKRSELGERGRDKTLFQEFKEKSKEFTTGVMRASSRDLFAGTTLEWMLVLL